MRSILDVLVVELGLLCPVVSVWGLSVSSSAELAYFPWQPRQEALIYFGGNAEHTARSGRIGFLKIVTFFFWRAGMAFSMSSLFTCLRHSFSAVRTEALPWSISQAEVMAEMNTACSLIFVLAWRSAILCSLREFVSTSFWSRNERLAESWIAGLQVGGKRRAWVELYAERRADECWKGYGET